MPITWWMDQKEVVNMYNGILHGNDKEWNLAIRDKVSGSGGCQAQWNKAGRERQIPYVFSLNCKRRNFTEDHGEGEGGNRTRERDGGKSWETWILKTNWGLKEEGERGRAMVGMEQGTCGDEPWLLHGNQLDNKLQIWKICHYLIHPLLWVHCYIVFISSPPHVELLWSFLCMPFGASS